MITLLHWHKYSVPPVTPMKLVAAAASFRPLHLKIQWWIFLSVARYHQSTHPALVPSGPYNPSGQSGRSLQVDFSHTGKRLKGLISLSDAMIPLPHLKIDKDTMKTILIHCLLPSLPLFLPFRSLVLPILLSWRDTPRRFLP